MPLLAAVARKLATQRLKPASAEAGVSEKRRGQSAAAASAPASCFARWNESHLFLLVDFRKIIHRACGLGISLPYRRHGTKTRLNA